MKRGPLLGLSVLLLSFAPLLGQQSSDGSAHPTDASVAFRLSTTGFGGEVSKLLTGHVAARVGGSFFSVSTTKSQSNISYAASLKLHTFAALIDLSPGQRGSFHGTVGIVTNPLTISGTGQSSSGRFTINGTSYRADSVGTLTLEGKFPGASPYAGLGFGTPASKGGALKLLFDLGAVLGKPTISLTSTGAASNPQLASDLQAQQTKTQHAAVEVTHLSLEAVREHVGAVRSRVAHQHRVFVPADAGDQVRVAKRLP